MLIEKNSGKKNHARVVDDNSNNIIIIYREDR